MVEGMSPENAAEMLREMSNDGKIDMASQLLRNIEERKASKILDAINDPTLGVQLLEKYKKLTRPPKKTRKR